MKVIQDLENTRMQQKQKQDNLGHVQHGVSQLLYLRSPVTLGPAHTPDKEEMILSVLVIASWTSDAMFSIWGRTCPLKSWSSTSFSKTGNARISFHKQMFLIKRIDMPNLYAATRAAFGTAFITSMFHGGTYEQENIRETIPKLKK